MKTEDRPRAAAKKYRQWEIEVGMGLALQWLYDEFPRRFCERILRDIERAEKREARAAVV